MKEPIRILCLEDVELDAELVRHVLHEGRLRFSWKRVESRSEFLDELRNHPPDLILSDSALPEFDGMTALEIARREHPKIPFFFVTGSLGEEGAIETLKRGATDYVLKTHLSRLVPAVRRALKEADSRAQREKAQERLRHSRRELRALSTHLQQVREAERTRIAREIHDELGQALTGLQLDICALRDELPHSFPELRERAEAISTCIDATINTVRRISTELRPGVLDELGLVAAVEWQAREFQRRTGITCRLHASVEEPDVADDVKTAFFRIFQETLTNVIRHAQASCVEVFLRNERRRFVLEICDDGRGISEQQIASTKSLGLIGMRERAALLRCEFHIRRRSGKGTAVTVRGPYPRRKKQPESAP